MSIIADIHKDLEKSAFQLIVEYRQRLQSVAFGLCKDESLAEDLVFRTFERVLARSDSYKVDTNLFGWMKSILENMYKDDIKGTVTRNTAAVRADELERCAGIDWSTDEQILRNSDSEAIRKAIAGLDPKYNKVLLMRYYGDFSLKEIARVMKLPLGTVCRRMQIAHRLLAGKLAVMLGRTKPLAVLAVTLSLATAATAAVATVPALAPVRNAITAWFAGGTDGDDRGTGVPPVQVDAGGTDVPPVREETVSTPGQSKKTTNKEQTMNLKTALTTTALAALAAVSPAQAEEPAPTIELTETAFAAALTAAEAGDVIVLPAGTLTLSKGYTIDKGVTVCGSGNRETIIKSTSTTECPFTLDCMNGAKNTATLANLTIDGCAITGAVAAAWKYPPAAVQIDAGFMTNVTVRNCRPLGKTNVSAVRLGGKTGFQDDVNLARMFDCTITNNNLGTISSSYGTVTVYYGTVSGCEIAYNKGRGAVGFFLTATGSATITCCDIHHNTCYPEAELTDGATAGSGGAGRIDSGTLSRCAISNNTAQANGGGLWLRGGMTRNCLIAKNSAVLQGGGVFVNSGNSYVVYSNIGGNSAATGAGVAILTGTTGFVFQGDIVADNGAGDESDVYSEIEGSKWKPWCCAFRPATYDYCLEKMELPDSTLRLADDVLVYRADGSYLTYDSIHCPVVDRGHTAADAKNITDAVDYFGTRRPIDAFVRQIETGRYDIGCCEISSSSEREIYVSPTGGDVYPYATPETAATDLNVATNLAARLAKSGASTTLKLLPGTYERTEALVVPPKTTLCGVGPLGSVVLTRTTKGDGVVHVDSVDSVVSNLAVRGGIGIGTYQQKVPGPSGVWVKKGKIFNCEISGCTVDRERYENERCHAQALVLGQSTTASGCIITNNVGSFGTLRPGNDYPRGAAVYMQDRSRLEKSEVAWNTGNIGGISVTFVNNATTYNEAYVVSCQIHDNHAYGTGGGMLNEGHALLQKCTICNNQTDGTGGGIRATGGDTKMFNCLIAGNTAGAEGGGLHASSFYANIYHCTFVDNEGTSGGGLYRAASTGGYAPEIVDTIFARNKSDDDMEVTGDTNWGVNLTNCFLPTGRFYSRGSRKDNVVADDPKFVNAAAGDYRLMRRSPCVDAGTSEYGDYAAYLKSDLDGTERPQVGKSGSALPDIGCYEYRQKSGFMMLLY